MTDAERKEKERLRSAARRAARAKTLAGINADLAKVMPGKPVKAKRKAAVKAGVAKRKAASPMAAMVKPLTKAKPKPTRVPEAMHAISFRGTDAQHAAFNKLGAGAWVRKLLDKHA